MKRSLIAFLVLNEIRGLIFTLPAWPALLGQWLALLGHHR